MLQGLRLFADVTPGAGRPDLGGNAIREARKQIPLSPSVMMHVCWSRCNTGGFNCNSGVKGLKFHSFSAWGRHVASLFLSDIFSHTLLRYIYILLFISGFRFCVNKLGASILGPAVRVTEIGAMWVCFHDIYGG